MRSTLPSARRTLHLPTGAIKQIFKDSRFQNRGWSGAWCAQVGSLCFDMLISHSEAIQAGAVSAKLSLALATVFYPSGNIRKFVLSTTGSTNHESDHQWIRARRDTDWLHRSTPSPFGWLIRAVTQDRGKGSLVTRRRARPSPSTAPAANPSPARLQRPGVAGQTPILAVCQ